MWSLPLTMELKKRAVCVVSALLCLTTLAAQVQAKPVEEEGGCLISGKHVAPGEMFAGPIGECSWNTCNRDGSFEGVSCGSFEVLPESGCNITETDLTVQYPDCCPRAICPDQPPTPVTVTLEKGDEPEN